MAFIFNHWPLVLVTNGVLKKIVNLIKYAISSLYNICSICFEPSFGLRLMVPVGS